MNTATQTVAAAWGARAEALADWALARFFVRTDRYGGYYVKYGETNKVSRPDTATPGAVTRRLLVNHFRARGPADVIGAYSLTAGTSTGRSALADIDAHNPEDDPDRNRRYAEHQYHKLAALGFHPLAADYGAGSFHAGALFVCDVAGDVLFPFGQWLVSDAKEFGFADPVESFPKQSAVPAGGFGNWLRLIGRHHKRDVWARVFNGTEWLEGAPAVEHVLSLTGDPPELIPDDAKPKPEPPPARTAPSTNGTTRHASGSRSGEDVFEVWKERVTLADVVAWLESRGHSVIRRTADRVEFTRAGKKRGEESFNVEVCDGVPITFNFSTNSGLPQLAGLNPVHLRCLLDFGSTDTSAMAKLAEKLKDELGWKRNDKPRAPDAPKDNGPPTTTQTTDTANGKTGAQIILEHFRKTYRPKFKRGNAIHTESGELVPMTVACALPPSALIAWLATASNVPRFASRCGNPGDVKEESLPKFFSTWARTAWADLLNELPDEDTAELGENAPARDEFRRLVSEAMFTPVMLGHAIERNGGLPSELRVETRPLVKWCEKFAECGQWEDIRDRACWCRQVIRPTDGLCVLSIAIRHELFSQLKADRKLREMGPTKFTTRAKRYGVARPGGQENRPHGKWVLVLEPEFVAELLIGAKDLADPNDEAAR